MTQIPATVTIIDLTAGAAPSGTELIEAVQTSAGIANSVKFTLSQIVPANTVTGSILQGLGTGLSANWVTPASFITVGTGLAIAGSTSLTLSLANQSGLSVLGVAGTATAAPLAIVGTGAQVLRVNDAGTSLAFGALNLGSAAAVAGVLPGANFSAVNLATSGAGGVQGFLPGTSILTASINGAQIATSTIGITQLMTAPGLSVLAVNSSGATSFSVISGTAGQVLAVNPAGTGLAFQGGMVLLNTLSPNNVATAGDTTSFTGNFRNYMVMFENLVPATNNVILEAQVATSGATFLANNYVAMATVDGTGTIVSDTLTTALLLSGVRSTTTVGNGTSYGVNGFMKVINPANATFRKHVVGQCGYLNGTVSGTTNFCVVEFAGYYDGGANAITGMQFLFSSGNIQTGTIRIYGMA